MAPIKVVIVEDDPVYALELEDFISELGYETAKIFENGEDAVLYLLEKGADLLLLDIAIEGKFNGIDVAKKIESRQIPVIFMTVFNDRQVYHQAKKTHPYGYLVKPFDKLTLQSIIDSCFFRSGNQERSDKFSEAWHESVFFNDHLFVKDKDKLLKIPKDDMLIIEADGNYCLLHTEERKFAVKSSLKRMAENFASTLHIRVHRKYLVRLASIENIDLGKNEIQVRDRILPLGENYRANLLKRLNRI